MMAALWPVDRGLDGQADGELPRRPQGGVQHPRRSTASRPTSTPRCSASSCRSRSRSSPCASSSARSPAPRSSGYLDIVLAAPVARATLVAGAVVVAAVVVAAVLAVMTAVTWVAGWLVGAEPSLAVLGRGMANVWPLAMFFGGLAVARRRRAAPGGPVTAVAAGTLVGMYVIDLVGKLAEPVEPLRACRRSSTTARRSRTGSTRSPSPACARRRRCSRPPARSLFERRDVR